MTTAEAVPEVEDWAVIWFRHRPTLMNSTLPAGYTPDDHHHELVTPPDVKFDLWVHHIHKGGRVGHRHDWFDGSAAAARAGFDE